MGTLTSPLLSIITINLNNAEALELTINSVISQNIKNFEYIVIDGGSNDKSIDVINRYKAHITFWISEKDNGIYNAMNKGIRKAKGQYCLFLNSGDILHSKNSSEIIQMTNPVGDIINFSCIVKDKNGLSTIVPTKKVISFYDFYKHTIIHQATLIKTELFQKIGYYNENLKITADWEFFIKSLFIYNCSYQSCDDILTIYDSNGISSRKDNQVISLKERESSLANLFPRFIKDYELIQQPQVYKYLQHIKNNSILNSIFILKIRIINKFLKIINRN